MLWRELKEHLNKCYFCKVNVKGFNRKTKLHVKYFNLDSALLPVAHCEKVPVPEFTGLLDIHNEILSEVSTTDDEEGEGIDMEFRPTDALLGKPILFNQLELNDLVRDLYLPKQYAELLASRLNEKNLLSHRTSVTYYHNREASFQKYFVSYGQLVYCKNIKGLLLEMGVNYVPGDC